MEKSINFVNNKSSIYTYHTVFVKYTHRNSENIKPDVNFLQLSFGNWRLLHKTTTTEESVYAVSTQLRHPLSSSCSYERKN